MKLANKRIAVLLEEGFEDLEFWVPVMRLREEGAQVAVLGLKAGKTMHGKVALPATSDAAIADAKADDYDGLVVPGGWAPDKLRRYDEVKDFVRSIYNQGKIIGLICHAGLVAISAGIIPPGSRATGSLGIKDDLINAGAVFINEPAFRDNQLVWGRVVADIPDFCRELVKALAEG